MWKKVVPDKVSLNDVKRVVRELGQKELPLDEATEEEKRLRPFAARERLKDKYLKGNKELFEFIDSTIDLRKIAKAETVILDTLNIFNVKNLEDYNQCLFINLCRLNDIRRVNGYFIEVYKKLKAGGFLVGKVDTIESFKQTLLRKYPRYLAICIYFFHFFFTQFLPSLPGLKQAYFSLTKGKNRSISKIETLGRLYFCGFRILGIKEINNSLYFIAQKVKTISFEQEPSYGPLIKLERLGYLGEIIHIYKLRTMFPYSEYLQEYFFRSHKLDSSGKIKNDFRVTACLSPGRDGRNWVKKK